MRKALLALLALVLPLACGHAGAATFADKNLGQLVAEAEQIFVGSVRSLQSSRLASGAIVTDATFSDLQMVKGSNAGADIVLRMLGGEVGGVRLEIPGLPQFRRDARYLVFVKGNGKDMFPVVGGPAGMYLVAGATEGAARIVLTWSGMPLADAIAAEVRASLAGAAQATSAVTLEQFVAAVTNRLSGQ